MGCGVGCGNQELGGLFIGLTSAAPRRAADQKCASGVERDGGGGGWSQRGYELGSMWLPRSQQTACLTLTVIWILSNYYQLT